MAALEVVELEELVQITLDLLGREIPGLAPGDAEAFIEERRSEVGPRQDIDILAERVVLGLRFALGRPFLGAKMAL